MNMLCTVVPYSEKFGDRLQIFLQMVYGNAFNDVAWKNSLGGAHVVLELRNKLVGHAAVIDRIIDIEGKNHKIKYVEAVAVEPSLQKLQLGHSLMGFVNFIIHQSQKPGFLATSSVEFYHSLRWRVWTGTSFVQTPNGIVTSASPRGKIMYLQTGPVELDVTKNITASWRNGDIW